MTNIHDFITVLHDLIKEKFPNTVIRMVIGSDYIENVLFELIECNKRFQYSPYELYNKSINYEETILNFIHQWSVYKEAK